jgi:hypothetical protein
MEDDLQWKTTYNRRWPPMEDILQWKTTSNGRRPPMEGDLQYKMTSNERQPPMEDNLQWKTTSNGRQPPMENNLQWKTTYNWRKPQNGKSGMYQYFWVLRGKLEESSEEISAQPSLFLLIIESKKICETHYGKERELFLLSSDKQVASSNKCILIYFSWINQL